MKCPNCKVQMKTRNTYDVNLVTYRYKRCPKCGRFLYTEEKVGDAELIRRKFTEKNIYYGLCRDLKQNQ